MLSVHRSSIRRTLRPQIQLGVCRYFEEASPIDHIDLTLVNYFRQLQAAGIQVGLDTGRCTLPHHCAPSPLLHPHRSPSRPRHRSLHTASLSALPQPLCGAGYPPEIQQGLIKALKLETAVDGWVSAYTVSEQLNNIPSL